MQGSYRRDMSGLETIYINEERSFRWILGNLEVARSGQAVHRITKMNSPTLKITKYQRITDYSSRERAFIVETLQVKEQVLARERKVKKLRSADEVYRDVDNGICDAEADVRDEKIVKII